MKFYGLMVNKTTHAEGIFIGTKNPEKKRCSVCRVPFNRSIPNFIAPISFEFIPSSATIGDFIFCTGNPYPLISKRVKDFFVQSGVENIYLNVEFVPSKIKRGMPSLPKLEEYYYFIPNSIAQINFSKTEIPKTALCTECGRESLQWLNPIENYLITNEDVKLFRIDPFLDGATYITEDFLFNLKEKGFTNLDNIIYKGEIEKHT